MCLGQAVRCNRSRNTFGDNLHIRIPSRIAHLFSGFNRLIQVVLSPSFRLCWVFNTASRFQCFFQRLQVLLGGEMDSRHPFGVWNRSTRNRQRSGMNPMVPSGTSCCPVRCPARNLVAIIAPSMENDPTDAKRLSHRLDAQLLRLRQHREHLRTTVKIGAHPNSIKQTPQRRVWFLQRNVEPEQQWCTAQCFPSRTSCWWICKVCCDNLARHPEQRFLIHFPAALR